VLWAGSDDGLVHVSRDGGATWTDVTPKGLPEWSQVNAIDVHPFEKGGLYVAATRYKLDDDQPILFRTTDYGATWTRIDGGIARDEFTRVVRADPVPPGLLYAGTERGVWVSFDDGARWQKLPALDPANEVAGLPQVPVTDLAVKDGALAAATQGRGYWVLDDLEVLRQLAPGTATDAPRLYTPRAVLRVESGGGYGGPRLGGKNPPNGVVLHYFLPEEPAAEPKVELKILDAADAVLRSFTRKPKKEGPDSDKPKKDARGEDLRQLPAEQGTNRFAWDLRLAPPETFDGLILWNGVDEGPRVPPGSYRARLTVGEWSETVAFEVLPDPRSAAGQPDLVAQYDFLVGVRDKLSATHRAIRDLRDVRGQLETLESPAPATARRRSPSSSAPKKLREAMTAIEERLYQTRNKSEQDPLNFPIRLNDKLGGVYQVASFGDHPPTEAAIAVRDELTESDRRRARGARQADRRRVAGDQRGGARRRAAVRGAVARAE
jgi:hypothetical protein